MQVTASRPFLRDYYGMAWRLFRGFLAISLALSTSAFATASPVASTRPSGCHGHPASSTPAPCCPKPLPASCHSHPTVLHCQKAMECCAVKQSEQPVTEPRKVRVEAGQRSDAVLRIDPSSSATGIGGLSALRLSYQKPISEQKTDLRI